MLNIRTVILSVLLVIVLALSARLVTNTKPEVTADLASESAVEHTDKAVSAEKDKVVETRVNRYRTGEYFDVPLSERARYINANTAPARLYRSPLDENFDVPLSERASYQKASPATASANRSHLDECFDVPLWERASCRPDALP